jgi:UvrD/REP helicase N-terminal domain
MVRVVRIPISHLGAPRALPLTPGQVPWTAGFRRECYGTSRSRSRKRWARRTGGVRARGPGLSSPGRSSTRFKQRDPSRSEPAPLRLTRGSERAEREFRSHDTNENEMARVSICDPYGMPDESDFDPALPWNQGVRGLGALPLINLDAPVIRVEAGPGTGKTFGLTRRVVRILHPVGLAVPGNRCLVVAFNRVIARDLKVSIDQELRADRRIPRSWAHGDQRSPPLMSRSCLPGVEPSPTACRKSQDRRARRRSVTRCG